jgi:hypothetical protein
VRVPALQPVQPRVCRVADAQRYASLKRGGFTPCSVLTAAASARNRSSIGRRAAMPCDGFATSDSARYALDVPSHPARYMQTAGWMVIPISTTLTAELKKP